MNLILNPYEARVIGCLLEKEITTPEQYPLSLNALANACNQKSNRDPVMDLDEATVQQTVDALIKRYLVGTQSGFGSRVTKYRQRFCNAEFGERHLSPQEVGIVCELLLRGPQTPGELRTHAERLCKLGDVSEVEAALAKLMARDEPMVKRLSREPGKRESRYAHLFGADEVSHPAAESSQVAPPGPPDQDRLAALEEAVAALREEVEQLKALILQLPAGPTG